MKSGLSKAQAAKRIYMFDKDGLVTMVSNVFVILTDKLVLSCTIYLNHFYAIGIPTLPD